MKRPAPQSVAAIVVIALLAGVAVITSRPSAPGAESDASSDYRGGGYRAWAALLAREDIATSRFVLRPIELDTRIDTLVSAQPSSEPGGTPRTAADLAALAGWVRAGGRLVYLGRNAALGRAETDVLALPFRLPGVGGRGRLTGVLAAPVPALADLGPDRMLLVEHAGRAELSDANGDIVVRYPLGRGEIVAIADTVPFTNAVIARAANARLAYLVGMPRRPGGVVAFDDGLHGALIDRPWYRALPIPLRVGGGIAGVAALLTLVGGALGTGARLPLHAAREPTSAEFIAALAALYERIRARPAAAAILSEAALAAVVHAGAADERLTSADLAAPPATDAGLLARAALAHTVWKEWTHGGNGDRRRPAFGSRTRPRRRR